VTDKTIKEQLLQDTQTWCPVAFFSWFVEKDGPVLHQLWVSVLGNTKWEPVETRDIKEMSRVYAECQVFGGGDDGGPDDQQES